MIHRNVQLSMEKVYSNAVVATDMDGEPCIAIAGHGKSSGAYIWHAVTLHEVKSLPYKEDVFCVCANVTGTKLFFGSRSGRFL